MHHITGIMCVRRFISLSILTSAVVLDTAGCGHHRAVPTQPGTLPLTVACPADMLAQTQFDTSLVSFSLPSSTGGMPPVSVNCSPASGTAFPIGTTAVTCTGIDAVGSQASCTFRVVVSTLSMLQGTKFLAFGDSLTAGEVTTTAPSLFDLHPELSYPTVLLERLAARYSAQTITVTNCGIESKTAVEDVTRLRDVLRGGACGPAISVGLQAQAIPGQFDALLLLEGTNDINGGDLTVIDMVREALRTDIRYAKDLGVAKVFLATLPPERVDAAALVPMANDAIRDLAASEGIVVVDLYTALGGDAATFIGSDGIHPTTAGYQIMADAFFAAITANFERAAYLTARIGSSHRFEPGRRPVSMQLPGVPDIRYRLR
jgi:lysophospholipase L1-like esterase